MTDSATRPRRFLLVMLSCLGLAIGHLTFGATPSDAALAEAGPDSTSFGSVDIGSSSYPVGGVNVIRLEDALVVNTTAHGLMGVSPANTWGAEVTVVDGVVTQVNDRQSTGATGSLIPSDGVLLSGHGLARDWLLRWATLGARVTLPSEIAAWVPTTATAAGSRGWLSGAAGDGVADGAFGAWRGTPVAIAGTWNDSYEAQTAQWSIQQGAEFGSWNADLDIAVGAIFDDRGETWAKAAAGAYDARWATALRAIAMAWGSKAGTVHLRFAHEFNGDWVPWKVTGDDAVAFVTSWKRFRSLQRSIMPKAKLVFCPNDVSSKSLALDWRAAFPGAAYVDEMAVDSYNQYPLVDRAADFSSKINRVDSRGAPEGIEKHRQFAASVGLPLAIAEWNTNASMGDADTYVWLFHDWVAANAGTGPGEVPYEIVFNVSVFSEGQFALHPTTFMPKAAAAYVAAF